MKKLLGLLLIIVLACTSCLFGPTSKKVMSYRDGRVFLSDRSYYKVGGLPAPWEKMNVRTYAVAFHNDNYGATIATDAFCGPSFEDLPLNLLTTQLVAGVENVKEMKKENISLDGRGALRTIFKGSVDGVPLTFDIVVVKKNKCIIDFMCVSERDNQLAVESDFQNFYNGFVYTK